MMADKLHPHEVRVAHKILRALSDEDSNYIKGRGLSTAIGRFLLELTGTKAMALKGLEAIVDDTRIFIENEGGDESGTIQ